MKVETIKSNYGPFGISLEPESDGDKEILEKFFDKGIRITAYNTITHHTILEPSLEKKYAFAGNEKTSSEELIKAFGFAGYKE